MARCCTPRFEGPGVLFYASDNDDAGPMRGSAHILMTDNRDQTEHLFNALSKGGTVTTPSMCSFGVITSGS